MLPYDSVAPYDTPYYTYDGLYFGPPPVLTRKAEDVWPPRPGNLLQHPIRRPPVY